MSAPPPSLPPQPSDPEPSPSEAEPPPPQQPPAAHPGQSPAQLPPAAHPGQHSPPHQPPPAYPPQPARPQQPPPAYPPQPARRQQPPPAHSQPPAYLSPPATYLQPSLPYPQQPSAYPQQGWRMPSGHAQPPWGQQPARLSAPRRGRSLGGAAAVTGLVLAAAVCLTAAVVGGAKARAELTRSPTAAERSRAAAAAVAARWQRWPAGTIFPVSLGYSTGLLTQETAHRVGISPGHACAAALVGPVAGLAKRDGCAGALRATYVDQLQGVLFTVGVLAFPTPARATAFAHSAGGEPLPAGLRALGFPGTASARFGDLARQAETRGQAGPYVVLTVAGYADGRHSGGKVARMSVFAPASQLASAILSPLAKPTTVNCASKQWSC